MLNPIIGLLIVILFLKSYLDIISRIEEIEKNDSTTTTAVLREFVEDVKCAKLEQEDWLDLHLTYRKACNVLGVNTSYDS